MKRQGQLIEKIADIENLQLAYHKAQKGKAGKIEVFEYGKRLQENLQNLQQQILYSVLLYLYQANMSDTHFDHLTLLSYQ